MTQAKLQSERTAPPSPTAQLTAVMRAEHARYHPNPIFVDELAVCFVGAFWKIVLSHPWLRQIITSLIPAKSSRAIPAVTRAWFGERQLLQAMANGTRQYVILGAGYDTFALRRGDLLDQLVVYEVDQKATQEEKLRRMARTGIQRPHNTYYVTADLEADSLYEVLTATGFDEAQPAMVSWMGVTYYLTPQVVMDTLRSMATWMVPGSCVVFDYLADRQSVARGWRFLRSLTAVYVALRGEPWISGFEPAQLPDLLQNIGYDNIENIVPHKVHDRLLDGRTDLAYPEFIGLCSATIGKPKSD